MDSFYLIFSAMFFLVCQISGKSTIVPFNKNYYIAWGGDHVTILDQGTQVQIRIDQRSGGGFTSKHAYGSGYFRMSLKTPKNSKGITTSFYLSSPALKNQGFNHDELDFEFLGNNGPPYILNTNVFAQDSGHREQQFKLWFDPTSDFHEYELLWNQIQIVFFVDKVPIRVFKNHKKNGARYPTLPMDVKTSLWNGTSWLGPVDWNKGPFLANYRGFEINGCPYEKSNPNECYSSNYEWNAPKNWKLDPTQEKVYQNVRNKYLIYDYCKSKLANNFVECQFVE
ncbi:hypothetical protein ACJIZ3_009522 [Penstemon smallii]|uniref:Xyloglucan endotransglucosylase/hydrolase n=1 Tax=Penstemon smallii TaxID=265156 RepID=A0ABD3TCT4_9LAMI